MEMEDEDLEMLRQAALRSMGSNKNRRRENPNQSRVNTSSRIKTNGNLIEIQPSDDFSVVASEEGLNSDDYVVEEFVLDGSDISINSSDCDEVIEEVIVSDPEEDENVVDKDYQRSTNACKDTNQEKRSPSRSLSSHRQNSSDEDESDAVSIKSTYSLIMDEEEDFQSVEAKFLSRKLQKQKTPTDTTNSIANDDVSSRRKRSRSPISLPSRTSRIANRRSRSRERDANRSTNRKSRSRSRTPPSVRRRNQSPSIRGTRRPYRTNSNEKNQRRRRTRSRSPNNRSSPPSNRSRFINQNSRRQKSRSKSPTLDKPKPRLASNSQTGAPKSPSEDKLPEKIQKTVKNNHIPPEQLDRLEKRRKKFEESEVAPRKQVIKIASSLTPTSKEKQSIVVSQSSKTSKPVSSTSKPVVLKEKVQKASKRSVELVNESDLAPVKNNDKASTRQNNCDSKEKCTSGDNQEDLRARLIKKKMEKQMQQGSGNTSSNSGGSNGPISSVVVPVNNKGSHRIFSQALKNSQLLDSASESSNSSTNKTKESSKKSERSTSLSSMSTGAPVKIHKPKSEVTTSRNSGSSSCKKIKLSSSSKGGSSLSSSKSKSSSGSSSGTKRVVSVTYS